MSKERENYFHAQLLLYYPWKSEDELKDGFSTYEEKYGSVKDIVDNNAERFKQMAEHLESAFQELAQNGPPESVWDAVAPTIEEDNVAARNEGCYAVRNLEEEDIEEHNDMMIKRGNDGEDNCENMSALSVMYTKEAQKDIMAHQSIVKV